LIKLIIRILIIAIVIGIMEPIDHFPVVKRTICLKKLQTTNDPQEIESFKQAFIETFDPGHDLEFLERKGGLKNEKNVKG
jgi:hypothetical protein